eukprot:jgi/Mesvir1/17334/Mv07729-RA.1
MSGCPYSRAEKEKRSVAHGDKNDVKPSSYDELVCPFGYGNSSAPKLGPKDCMICRTLLFDAVRVQPCRHVFCRDCLRTQPCCPLCLGDVEGLVEDAEIQAEADELILRHAQMAAVAAAKEPTDQGDAPLMEPPPACPFSKAMRKGAGGDVPAANASGEGSGAQRLAGEPWSMQATMLLEIGVKAFHAKNLPSAHARLSRCCQLMRQELEAGGMEREGAAALAMVARRRDLAEVLGMLGDIRADLDGSLRMYQESVHAIAPPGEEVGGQAGEGPAVVPMLASLQDDEPQGGDVRHTALRVLTLSLNKLGDAHLRKGDRSAARQHYRSALALREKELEAARAMAKCPASAPVLEHALDVATSLAKLADLDMRDGDQQRAQDTVTRALHELRPRAAFDATAEEAWGVNGAGTNAGSEAKEGGRDDAAMVEASWGSLEPRVAGSLKLLYSFLQEQLRQLSTSGGCQSQQTPSTTETGAQQV